jgi:hypothetical protein
MGCEVERLLGLAQGPVHWRVLVVLKLWIPQMILNKVNLREIDWEVLRTCSALWSLEGLYVSGYKSLDSATIYYDLLII